MAFSMSRLKIGDTGSQATPSALLVSTKSNKSNFWGREQTDLREASEI